MIAKKHIVGFRVDDTELESIKKQVDREHISYMSALIRKATFWYIDFMNRPESKAPRKVDLNEENKKEG